MTEGKLGPTLHERLRYATRLLHHAAEEAFDAEQRLSTMESYVVLLDQLWSLHAGVELGLRAHGEQICGLELEGRRRSALLALDLKTATRRAPRLDPVSAIYHSLPAAMGGLYVLEGSMLGGRTLLARAECVLGVTEANGGQFLAGDGVNTGRRWRSFLEALGKIPATGQEADDAEAGARDTFALFISVLGPSYRAPAS